VSAEDAHWNAEHQAVEFGVEIGQYRGAFGRICGGHLTSRAAL